MKISLSKQPSGTILCQVNDSLSDSEFELLVRGVSKFLANGKARIDVEIAKKVPPPQIEKIQKALAPHVEMARKLGGEIRFRSPGESAAAEAASVSPAKVKQLEFELEHLREENRLLAEKLSEALAMAGEPSQSSSKKELQAALEHYRALAGEFQPEP